MARPKTVNRIQNKSGGKETSNINITSSNETVEALVNNGFMYSEAQTQWRDLMKLRNENAGADFIKPWTSAYINNPILMNQRLKNLTTYPSKYNKTKIEEMVADPQNNERELRALSHYVYNVLTPIWKQTNMLADILTYRTYINVSSLKSVTKVEKEYARIANFLRKFDPVRTFRQVTLSTIIEGKTFWYLRDDSGEDNICLQRMPSDYVKVTAKTQNNFQVAIDMTYFLNPANSVAFWPPEFKNYLDKFYLYYDKDNNILNLDKLNISNPKDVIAYQDNSSMYFWQFLDISKVYVFSMDESSPVVAPLLMSSFGSAIELDTYKALEQQLLSIPLSSLLTAEIDFSKDNKSGNYANDTAITADMAGFFTEIIQQKMPESISAVAAPFKNFKLHEFSHVTNRDSILGDAIKNYYTESGMSNLISVENKPVMAQIKASEKIESRLAEVLYPQYQCFLNNIISKFDTFNSFVIHIEGNVFEDDSEYAKVKESILNGQSDLIPKQQSFFGAHIDEAIATSEYMRHNKYYGNLQQLIPAYQSSNIGSSSNPAGRPSANPDSVESDNTAASIESGTNTTEGREVSDATFSKVMTLLNEEDLEEFSEILEDYGYGNE